MARDPRMPVVWLYGPPGVGKSTLGWALFEALSAAGTRVAYVDLDQVGMCYGEPTAEEWAPEPQGDHGRHRLQATNLDDLLPGFAAAGATGVVVSGVVAAGRGVDLELVPRGAITRCRLRVDAGELRRRVAGRDRPTDEIEHIVRYAADLDRLDDEALDLTGTSVPQALRRVRDRIGHWPGASAGSPRRQAPVRPGGAVLWLSGAVGVGKSAVGWQLYELTSRLGVRCAFVDVQQLGFLRPVPADDPGRHRLMAANLSAVWANDRRSGARGLIVVGSLDSAAERDVYTDALGEADVTHCHLRADRDVLAERLLARGRGEGPPIAGDDLVGRPGEELRRIADRADAVAAPAGTDVVLDTDELSAREAAREVLRRTDWLGLAAHA